MQRCQLQIQQFGEKLHITVDKGGVGHDIGVAAQQGGNQLLQLRLQITKSTIPSSLNGLME